MNKLNLLIYSFLFIIYSGFINDLSAQTEFEIFLENNYKNNTEEFYETLYTSIRYPRQARQDCVLGKLYIDLSISENGTIDSTSFSSNLQDDFRKEIENVLNKIKTNWVTGKRRNISFTIAFNIGDKNPISGDLVIIAYGQNLISGNSRSACKTNGEITEKFAKFIKKKKFTKARRQIELLLDRDPRSIKFLGLLKFLESKELENAK